MLQINPIIAGAAANVLVGVGLHSKYTFGPMLSKLFDKKITGLKDMPLRLAIEALSSLMKASALYIAILTFQKSEFTLTENMYTRIYSWFVTDMKMETSMMASLKIAGFFWLGFMVPHILCHLAWDEHMTVRKSIAKAVISLIHFLAMGAAIGYFG